MTWCITLAATLLMASSSGAAYSATQSFSDAREYQDVDIAVDYQAFSDILKEIVFDVGPSDRTVSRGTVTQTGTRINRTNTSRYRFEGNRVIFHLLNDGHLDVISSYRRELEQLPEQIDLARLNENEQLAYWLNLHNTVVLDELARAYPVRRPASMQIDGEPFEDAPIVNLPSGAVSLNHIRHQIIADRWSDPRVMYGLFTGEVGGPSIRNTAFSGATVWRQLDQIANEFVNSLRGVDFGEDPLNISELYYEFGVFFDDDDVLRAHLLEHARYETRELVQNALSFDAARYDQSIADLTNGARCGGGIVGQLEITTGARRTFNGGCEVLPPTAIELVTFVQDRKLRLFREGRLGTVTVRDLPTDDNGNVTEPSTN